MHVFWSISTEYKKYSIFVLVVVLQSSLHLFINNTGPEMSASAESMTAAASLDKYGEEDIFSLLIRYGLYVGALFQFVCISAAVLMENSPDNLESGEVTEREGEPVRTRLHKIRKLEKKKRR
ncbi:protein anon-73B1 [Drosophila eugracilis]|uniref:protein anon-73B1 n=1 Tax=Drosophila eugracilis TaxID=29029 RepID=UPI0007E792E2|nr:protein anon-73B1 [Drosophila eugracilis]